MNKHSVFSRCGQQKSLSQGKFMPSCNQNSNPDPFSAFLTELSPNLPACFQRNNVSRKAAKTPRKEVLLF